MKKAPKSRSQAAPHARGAGKRSVANSAGRDAPDSGQTDLYKKVTRELERSSLARSSPKNRVDGYIRTEPGPGRLRSRKEFANLRRLLRRMDRLVDQGYTQKAAAKEVCRALDVELADALALDRAAGEILRQARWSKDRSQLVLPSISEQAVFIARAEQWAQRAVQQIQASAEKKPRGEVGPLSHALIESDNLRKYYRKWKRKDLKL
jgi:hypothetical protein